MRDATRARTREFDQKSISGEKRREAEKIRTTTAISIRVLSRSFAPRKNGELSTNPSKRDIRKIQVSDFVEKLLAWQVDLNDDQPSRISVWAPRKVAGIHCIKMA